MPPTRFTKEFQDEAVRLALTSGRSRREIAADLGIGLSTLRHWLDRRREREIDDPPAERQEDMAAELKRLRRENEILRQEREILKRATANGMDRPCSRREHGRTGLSRSHGAMP
jgi:transposase